MSSTANLNFVNVAVEATAQRFADGAMGQLIQATDNKYYNWQGSAQAIPIGIGEDPAEFAARMRDAMPEVNGVRIPFNAWSFNADGTFHPAFQAFLEALTAQGFQILFTYADGEAQRFGGIPVFLPQGTAPGSTYTDPQTGKSYTVSQNKDGNGNYVGLPYYTDTKTSNEIYAELAGDVHARMNDSMDKLLDWIDANPGVAGNVYGIEFYNEPATFARGVDAAGAPADAMDKFASLYASQIVQTGEMLATRFDGKLLVGGWDYSANFDVLADAQMPDGTSVLDYIRAGLGDQLVWSAHLYPGWGKTNNADDAQSLRQALEETYADLAGDDIVITETSGNAGQVYNAFIDNLSPTLFAEVASAWMAENGIGIAWWAGTDWGAQLAKINTATDSTLFQTLHSVAAANNYFTLRDAPAEHAAGEVLSATLSAGTVRFNTNDPQLRLDGDSGAGLDGIGFGFGFGGNDTISGLQNAVNMLYGGLGQDELRGTAGVDYLYGQEGHDRLFGAGGNDYLFGGEGNDLLVSMGGFNTLYGGEGSDRFSVWVGGQTLIADFAALEGDTLDFMGYYNSFEELSAHVSQSDLNGDGVSDLLIWHGFGSYTAILGLGDYIDYLRYFTVEFSYDGAAPEPAQLLAGTEGDDLLTGGNGNDTLSGGTGLDTLVGGAGNDTMYDTKSFTVFDGGAGNDTISAGKHGSSINAGDGDDVINLLIKAAHTVTLGGGRNTVNIGLGDTKTAAQVTITDFKPGQDVLTYKNLPLDFDDLPSGASLVATAEGWVLTLTEAGRKPITVTITAALPEDLPDTPPAPVTGQIYVPGQPHDPRGLQIPDTPQEAAASYGETAVHLSAQSGLVIGSTQGDTLVGADSNDTLQGGLGDDTINAGRGNDLVLGGAGNDTLSGSRGSDTIVGGDGDDLILVDWDETEHIWTGAGNDIVNITYSKRATNIYVYDFNSATDQLQIDGVTLDLDNPGEDVTVASFLQGQKLTLTGKYMHNGAYQSYSVWLVDDAFSLPDAFSADPNALSTGFDSQFDPADPLARLGEPGQSILGTDAAETLVGGSGDDTIITGRGDDLVLAGGGDDSISAFRGAKVIEGGSGNDTITGGYDGSTISGGLGDDLLTIRLDKGGDNLISGGEGADQFVFVYPAATKLAQNTITDFSAEDRLLYAGSELTGLSAAALAAMGIVLEVDGEGSVLSFATGNTLTLDDYFWL